jgi:hypothetical protein
MLLPMASFLQSILDHAAMVSPSLVKSSLPLQNTMTL